MAFLPGGASWGAYAGSRGVPFPELPPSHAPLRPEDNDRFLTHDLTNYASTLAQAMPYGRFGSDGPTATHPSSGAAAAMAAAPYTFPPVHPDALAAVEANSAFVHAERRDERARQRTQRLAVTAVTADADGAEGSGPRFHPVSRLHPSPRAASSSPQTPAASPFFLDPEAAWLRRVAAAQPGVARKLASLCSVLHATQQQQQQQQGQGKKGSAHGWAAAQTQPPPSSPSACAAVANGGVTPISLWNPAAPVYARPPPAASAALPVRPGADAEALTDAAADAPAPAAATAAPFTGSLQRALSTVSRVPARALTARAAAVNPPPAPARPPAVGPAVPGAGAAWGRAARVTFPETVASTWAAPGAARAAAAPVLAARLAGSACDSDSYASASTRADAKASTNAGASAGAGAGAGAGAAPQSLPLSSYHKLLPNTPYRLVHQPTTHTAATANPGTAARTRAADAGAAAGATAGADSPLATLSLAPCDSVPGPGAYHHHDLAAAADAGLPHAGIGVRIGGRTRGRADTRTGAGALSAAAASPHSRAVGGRTQISLAPALAPGPTMLGPGRGDLRAPLPPRADADAAAARTAAHRWTGPYAHPLRQAYGSTHAAAAAGGDGVSGGDDGGDSPSFRPTLTAAALLAPETRDPLTGTLYSWSSSPRAGSPPPRGGLMRRPTDTLVAAAARADDAAAAAEHAAAAAGDTASDGGGNRQRAAAARARSHARGRVLVEGTLGPGPGSYRPETYTALGAYWAPGSGGGSGRSAFAVRRAATIGGGRGAARHQLSETGALQHKHQQPQPQQQRNEQKSLPRYLRATAASARASTFYPPEALEQQKKRHAEAGDKTGGSASQHQHARVRPPPTALVTSRTDLGAALGVGIH